MSGAKVLDFNAVSEFGNLDFSHLEKRLKQRLKAIKTVPDLERLIKLMNPLLKAERFSAEEQTVLRRLRQRAYDRRRNPKFQTLGMIGVAKSKAKIQTIPYLDPIQQQSPPLIEQSFSAKPIFETGVPMSTVITEKALTPEANHENFTQGALRALASINGEHVVKTAPKLLLWLSAAVLVSYFLWQQSVDLYESAGFKDSLWAAAGGVLMIIGFAAQHAITRSKLALLLCIYASGYEAYLMISGTIENEHHIQNQSIQSNPDLVFVKEKAAKSLAFYHELKQRYENPESKVFKNDWFLKSHLNPAWQESLSDHNELMAKESLLTGDMRSGHITWLKILYRLGLVFLCMMLVHRFFAVWVGKPR